MSIPISEDYSRTIQLEINYLEARYIVDLHRDVPFHELKKLKMKIRNFKAFLDSSKSKINEKETDEIFTSV